MRARSRRGTDRGQAGQRRVVSAPLSEPPACGPTARNIAGPWMTYAAAPPESPLTVTLADVPDEAPFDGTLRFTVELANPGPDPVSLDPCPVYLATYGEGGFVVHFENELNCPQARGSIPPRDHLRFAVAMRLPGDKIPAAFSGGLFVTVHLGDGSVARSEATGLRVSDA